MNMNIIIQTFFNIIALIILSCNAFSMNAFANINTPVNVDSRIRTMVYNPNEIYTLNLKMGFQSIVEFSLDEVVELISVGDPYPWKLTPIDRRLFIKPLQIGTKTNLTIITNKRTYYFDLQSDVTSSDQDFDVIHVVRFFYPQTPIDESKYSMDEYISAKDNKMTNTIKSVGNLAAQSVGNTDLPNTVEEKSKERIAINLNYSFVGEYNSSTPVEIFDDRKDTFFRFRTNDPTIKIYSISTKGKRTLMSNKQVGDFIVVSGVHAKFHIKNGVYENYVYNDLKVNKKEE